tara:strand:+ start:65 stop:304 length:240 start_codon:yes stop_codon:yes gene_type:complete
MADLKPRHVKGKTKMSAKEKMEALKKRAKTDTRYSYIFRKKDNYGYSDTDLSGTSKNIAFKKQAKKPKKPKKLKTNYGK